MTMDISTIAVLFTMLLLLLGLGFTVAIDPYLRREQRNVILIVSLLCLSLIIQNLWEDTLFVNRTDLALKNTLSAYGYSVRPVILLLFFYIIVPNGKKWCLWVLAGINTVLYCTSPFTKLCFEIRASDFASMRGPLWPACFVVSAILLAELLAKSFLRYRETRKSQQLIPFIVSLIIIISVIMDLRVNMESQPVTFLTIAITVGSVFYYIWLHLQFVREHERDLMASQRIRLMLSQIKPHFLFNSLGAIEALCDSDPKAAKQATVKFAQYLRGNVNSLYEEDMIPFERELQHTRFYLELEQIRFEDDLRVEYEIACTVFFIPALTLEPIVENAVRHGVRGNMNGKGTVTIASSDRGDHYEILVMDDGPGFDPGIVPEDDRHVGIRNVRKRLKTVCGGDLKIESSRGRGTTVTIMLPKEK